jgi:hypothetical protein
MANIKISDMTAAAAASGTQELEVNDSGSTKKVTGAQLSTYIRGTVTLGDLSVTASAADLNTTDVTTLGTSEASKVVTADANGEFTFSNPPASGTAYSFSIEIIQDASASGFVVTWPASVDWPSATAPTLTATASAKDVFVFTTRDGGTNWYGFTAGQALG